MRVVLILLVLLPILLTLAQAAPPKSTKPATTTTTGTSPKKGKQLVYYVPGQARSEVVNNLQHDEQAEDAEEEEEADDDVEDEDADDDVDDDDNDDAFDIPAFDKVFPNPDGRPVGPNSYDAFQRHRPGGAPSNGPGALGQAGPRVAGQAGPRVSGQAGPGQRRTNGPYLRTDIQDVDSEEENLGLTPPYPGARLLQIIPADDPTGSNDDESESNNIYPNTRDGRQSYVGRVPVPNYRYRAPVSRPVIVQNRRNYNYNYVPVRRPISGLSHNVNSNRRQMMGYPTQYRPVQQMSRRPVIYSPVRRNPAVVPVPVPMSYRPQQVVRGPYVPYSVPQVRAGTGRGYNPWSWSPLRGDNYNPEYVVNPTEMLSRRKFRYHPSQRLPVQRIPLNSGMWGNPREIQRDPWTGSNYHAGYLHSQF